MSTNLPDFDFQDLVELSPGEKTEIWRLLNSVYHSTVEEDLNGNEDLEKKLVASQYEVLKASGTRCKDLEAFLQASTHSGSQNSTEDTLLKNIEMVGLEYSTPTPKNGDCFFEAVSDQLIRLGLQRQNPADLRQNVIDFLEQNPVLEQEDGHIHWDNFVENGDMKAYLTRMSKKGEWADHVVVLGMSAVLKCNIIIITSSPNTHPDDNIIWINCNNASADLLLLGHIWENHYQSLRPFYLKPKTEMLNSTDDYLDNGLPKQQQSHEDNCFLEYIRSTFCKSVGSDVQCIIKCVRNDEDTDDIITAHLMQLDDMLIGRFNHRNKNKDTLQFRCERCRKPRGKNKGSLLTVANGCSAYVSFRFVQHMSKKAVIIRQRIHHTGHDLKNLQEKHLSKPDPALCQYIDALLEQNKKPMQILCMAWKWARDHGKTDVHDRRYFVSPQDIKCFSQQYKMKHRCHPNDSLAVHHLCTQTLKDEIVLYQELIQ